MDTKRSDVYKCEHCGKMVEVLHIGTGTLRCCKEPMKLYEANAVDAATEKHVPVLEEVDGGFKVTVGSVAHPMADDHYIEWIELVADGRVSRQFLNPGDTPEAMFCACAKKVTARAYCNLHGLWRS